MLKQRPEVQTTPAAYSIIEFCEAYRLSRSGFYKLRAAGRAPALMQVGKRVLISLEAAAAWAASMTVAK